MQEKGLAVVILAAGKGTRMKSPLAKVLQPLCGQPLLQYVLKTVDTLHPDRLICVVGHQADEVRTRFHCEEIEFVEQREQLGTGHAAMQAVNALSGFAGDILVLCGDMPFIRTETLKSLISKRRDSGAAMSVLTLLCPGPKDFGLIRRDGTGKMIGIIEQRDASEEEKKIDEFNSGVYCFDSALFLKALDSLGRDNAQQEYYLTDAVQYMVRNGYDVVSVETESVTEILGINSPEDLKQAEAIWGDLSA